MFFCVCAYIPLLTLCACAYCHAAHFDAFVSGYVRRALCTEGRGTRFVSVRHGRTGNALYDSLARKNAVRASWPFSAAVYSISAFGFLCCKAQSAPLCRSLGSLSLEARRSSIRRTRLDHLMLQARHAPLCRSLGLLSLAARHVSIRHAIHSHSPQQYT